MIPCSSHCYLKFEGIIFRPSFHTIEPATISNTSPQLMSFFHAFFQWLPPAAGAAHIARLNR
jgi:hypothetical protein